MYRKICRNMITAIAMSVAFTLPVYGQADSKPDTGVGKNGVALPSSPAFVASGGEKVTMDNIVRAETAKYLAEETILTGPNKFRHERKGIDLNHQTVIRSNFDQIYSYAVYDVRGGVKITVPDYDLLQLVQVFDENHVTIGVILPGETKEFTKADVTYGDHIYLFMRTQPRSYDEKGMEEMRKRQDMVAVEAGSAEPYESEVKYDVTSFNKLRIDLIRRAVAEGKPYLGFVENIKDIQAPQYQLINLAGWGGLPVSYAHYFPLVPADEAARNAAHSSVSFTPPELDYDKGGYWSITIYDKDGWVVTDPFNTNSNKAKLNKDGTVTLNFNGPEGSVNNIKVAKDWNALFRCYLPKSRDGIVAFGDDFLQNHKIMSVK